MHILQQMIKDRKKKKSLGIYSACTASAMVIEAVLRRAKENGCPALIEATANQVNQFGGYTGMKPADFAKFVEGIADTIGFDKKNLILGGDHLGPLTWQKDTEKDAMKKAVELVIAYTLAGFTKIHLDTSMRLADDDTTLRLSDETIANRAATLAAAITETCKKESLPLPVFIIGSEVPIPGGAQEEEDSISVTSPEDMKKTYKQFETAFAEKGLQESFKNVIGIVVQPGVEFGDSSIFPYSRTNAKNLTAELKSYKTLCYEGHSTDYQPPKCLKEMVEDGIAILKVGPALTFYQREAYFALAAMEKVLVDEDRSDFMEVLEKVMLEKPEQWGKYYHGTEKEQTIKRQYSYSDRIRYYLPEAQVAAAAEKLLENLAKVEIPLSVLSQFMPIEAAKVRDGKLSSTPKELVIARIQDVLDEYLYATGIIKSL